MTNNLEKIRIYIKQNGEGQNYKDYDKKKLDVGFRFELFFKQPNTEDRNSKFAFGRLTTKDGTSQINTINTVTVRSDIK